MINSKHESYTRHQQALTRSTIMAKGLSTFFPSLRYSLKYGLLSRREDKKNGDNWLWRLSTLDSSLTEFPSSQEQVQTGQLMMISGSWYSKMFNIPLC